MPSNADAISATKRGIHIEGDGSFSIDQQRYNFQFGGQVFWEIKDGKRTRMLRDVAYQADNSFDRELRRFIAPDLIVIDDLSYPARPRRTSMTWYFRRR